MSTFVTNILNRIIWTNLLWKFPQSPCCCRAPHPSSVANTIVVVVIAPFRNNFNPTLLIIGQTRKMISIPLFDNWPDKKSKRLPFIRCKLENKREQAGGQPEHGQTNETTSYKEKEHPLRSTKSLEKISGTFLLHLHQRRLASSLVAKILVSSCATS